eukprot:1246658-Ditylum_brightwellii.AAC.1
MMSNKSCNDPSPTAGEQQPFQSFQIRVGLDDFSENIDIDRVKENATDGSTSAFLAYASSVSLSREDIRKQRSEHQQKQQYQEQQ